MQSSQVVESDQIVLGVPQAPDREADLIACWRLDSFYTETTTGKKTYPFGENVDGVIIYTDAGLMSVHVSNVDRSQFTGDDIFGGTLEESADAYNSFISYFGRFSYLKEEGAVLHIVEQSLYPNWSAVTQKRYVLIENTADGDKVLYINTPTMIVNGEESIMVLRWVLQDK